MEVRRYLDVKTRWKAVEVLEKHLRGELDRIRNEVYNIGIAEMNAARLKYAKRFSPLESHFDKEEDSQTQVFIEWRQHEQRTLVLNLGFVEVRRFRMSMDTHKFFRLKNLTTYCVCTRENNVHADEEDWCAATCLYYCKIGNEFVRLNQFCCFDWLDDLTGCFVDLEAALLPIVPSPKLFRRTAAAKQIQKFVRQALEF